MVETSRSFHGGNVTVDFNHDGEVIGCEFLGRVGMSGVSELRRFASKTNRPIIPDMLHATMHFWDALDVGAGLWARLIKRKNSRDKSQVPMKGEWPAPTRRLTKV